MRQAPAGVEWPAYVDGKREFRLEHPPEWEVRPGVAGLLVALVAPADEGGFRSNLNVVRKTGAASRDLDVLAQNAIREVGRVLTDLLVLDVDNAVVAGLPARRLLFSYRQGIFGLTAEQWVWVDGERHWTISGSASSERYDSVADVFAGVVSSFEVADA